MLSARLWNSSDLLPLRHNSISEVATDDDKARLTVGTPAPPKSVGWSWVLGSLQACRVSTPNCMDLLCALGYCHVEKERNYPKLLTQSCNCLNFNLCCITISLHRFYISKLVSHGKMIRNTFSAWKKSNKCRQSVHILLAYSVFCSCRARWKLISSVHFILL